MVCPNCRHEYIGSKCPLCKVDAVLYAGTINISNKLYNKGLNKMKVSDLSSGIDCLTKSIKINKDNVNARNLLGLAFFEVGRVGDALKHWVISQSLIKEGNLATRYIELVRKNSRSLERLNDSVNMYNQALEYMKQKSEDLAIIQLRKAIELNPKFIDALNMLALCFMVQGDREKAMQALERVLSVDFQNPIALNYYAELNPGRPRPDQRTRKSTQQNAAPPSKPSSYKRAPMREKKQTNFHIAEILSFIIGSLITFTALYLLVIPALQGENDRLVTDYQARLADAERVSFSQIQQSENMIAEKESIITELNIKIEEWMEKCEVSDRSTRVLHAYVLFKEDRLQEAVDMVEIIDRTGLAYDIVGKASEIIVVSYPKLAAEYFNAGKKAYETDKDYDKALVDFEKAEKYMDENASQVADLLYYLASLYYRDEYMQEKAYAYYTALREAFPTYPSNSSARRREINNIIEALRESLGIQD